MPAERRRYLSAVTSPALRIDRLNRRFGNRTVVENLSLEVAPGERVALRGPNGSGKTTVLRTIIGTVAPDRGTVLVDGHPAGSLAARYRIGASLAQERSFYLRLTGHENLVFYARLRSMGKRLARAEARAVEEELEITDIAKLRVDRCSTGMVQQLSIARALLADPRILLLDEPTRSLDGDAFERMWGAIDRRKDVAVVIASHQKQDLDRCGRIVELPT